MQTKTLSLYHIIKEPSIKKDKTPVLFMLHGYGSNEEDLFSFAPELPDELFIISVKAPHVLMPSGNAWFAINYDAEKGKWSDDKQAIESRNLIAKFIDEACNAYDLDSNNVTMLGFSQGTILSYSVALSYPQKIKNVIALSGYINENILEDKYADNDFSNLHIYASHGNVDQIIPVDWARKAPPTLKKLNIDHVYEEFPVGHGVAPQNFHSFKEWLTKKL